MIRIPLFLASIATVALVSVIPAAEPAAGNGTNDVAVLLDDGSLWRHLHLAGPSTLLTSTGTVVKT
jgi:hypothetical protein